MKSEIEAKFLDVDFEKIRTLLLSLGGICEQPMRLMRRVTIDSPDMKLKNAFLRVRDEGNRVTMTYKQFDALSVDGAKEIEIEVSSFENTIALVEKIGRPYKAFQESKRETWRLDNVEVALDEWPWLKPYIEIEGESAVALKEFAIKMGLDWSGAVFGDVMVAYRAQYPHLTIDETIGNIPFTRFNDPLPDMLIRK